ncbi:MAG: HepT-like ribonuclease domain-containing protein [Campylobacterota bacterium]|nr:HepT-like ribonuclease domain-containing protein [Campylobacterota bacterium]
MFDSKNILHVLTMLESIEKIFIYSSDFEDEKEFYFANKQLNFNATVNLLIAIGEENKKIDEDLKISNKINWKNISAMRDKISHNYRGIDESMMWEIIKDYLPVLKELLIEMLPKIENSEQYINEALKTQYYEELHYLTS